VNLILPKNYENKNPKILSHIHKDIKDNSKFHYLFMGVVGCGKTHLAELIAKHYNDFRFVECRSIYDDYLRVMNGNFSDQSEAIARRQNVLRGKNVFFDDIGDERNTETAHYFIGSLIEDRYNWIKKGLAGSTILTTNLNIEQLGELYGHRVVDRIREMFVIMKFNKYNFRARKKLVIEG